MFQYRILGLRFGKRRSSQVYRLTDEHCDFLLTMVVQGWKRWGILVGMKILDHRENLALLLKGIKKILTPKSNTFANPVGFFCIQHGSLSNESE